MNRYTINIKVGLLAALFVMTFSACEKPFDEVNDNPNLPKEVSERTLLPAAQISLGYTYGGDIARYNGVFTQTLTGADRQFIGYGKYLFTEEDFNNLWNNMYAGNMADLNRMMEIADKNPGFYDTYDAIAHILMAYSLMTVTDLFGDVPYSQAFQGVTNLRPAYDSQQTLYESTIPGLLDESISILLNNNLTGDDLEAPASDDLIYNGDTEKWLRFAYGIKARLAIHKAKGSRSSAAAQEALNAVSNGLSSNADNPGVRFGANFQNPWFQYIDQRGDISFSSLDDYFGIGNNLTNSMEVYPDSLTFSWDFGDGTQENNLTTPEVSHDFLPDSTYTVTLTLTNVVNGTAISKSWQMDVEISTDEATASTSYETTRFTGSRDEAADTSVDFTASYPDIRYYQFLDVAGNYYYPGAPSALYMGDDAPIRLMTYAEQKFIEAEAHAILGQDVDAKRALEDAIRASYDFVGLPIVEANDYIELFVNWDGASDKVKLILEQKYIANYLQPESWNDWRRTGYPDLTPNPGAVTPIPRRYIYPTNERQYNPNAVNTNSSMLSPRLWWDN